jgi:hypothetical protein
VAYNARADVQAWYASQEQAAGDAQAARQLRQLARDSRRLAVEQFEIVLKLNPSDRDALANLSATTRQLGDDAGGATRP